MTIWPYLSPKWRYRWLNRDRFWFYAGIAFWLFAPAYIGGHVAIYFVTNP